MGRSSSGNYHMFDTSEILEILEHLGYEIHRESEERASRRLKAFGARLQNYVMYQGEKRKPEEVFKIELKKRIFNI